ncbi:hypothetical protein GCM10022243_08970 [Saccharothrix violaceirubra]|uniref:PE family protein n=1 Tax=Saccharothrix violaceirubra TaxID=413306 RepID=A0A7W7SYN3_9PSEU|nr:hypothetical protein [Saccharothrix violaceirubra]MBB4963308.1 hypothetical protein [Saccharothrix violaceirubra]
MYIAEAGSELPPRVVALSETVRSGRVSLDPTTGEELRRMLVEQMDQVDSWLERAGRLAQPAPLGTNPVGNLMAHKFEIRADGEPLSFVAVMTSYREVLRQTYDAVDGAIRNFQQVDDEHRHELKRLNGN